MEKICRQCDYNCIGSLSHNELVSNPAYVFVCMFKLGVRGEHVCVMGDSVGPLSAMRSRLTSQSRSVRNNIWPLHPQHMLKCSRTSAVNMCGLMSGNYHQNNVC